jgi:hypothetical protein
MELGGQMLAHASLPSVPIKHEVQWAPQQM